MFRHEQETRQEHHAPSLTASCSFKPDEIFMHGFTTDTTVGAIFSVCRGQASRECLLRPHRSDLMMLDFHAPHMVRERHAGRQQPPVRADD